MLTHHIAREFVKQALKEKVDSRKSLQSLKNQFSLKYKISSFSSIELIKAYAELIEDEGL